MEAAAALPATRHQGPRERDTKKAAIRCVGCGTYYDVAARQARDIRKGKTRRLCALCRGIEEADPQVVSIFAVWWEYESGLSLVEIAEICAMIFCAEEVVVARLMSEVP